jgi:putative transposase
MNRQGLTARRPKRFIATTDSNHSYRVARNLLKRDFHTDRPDEAWVSDITYLRAAGGWLYLTTFIDLYSRKIVGWKVSRSLGHEPVVAAFERAARSRGNLAGLIIHSDRGVQYCCEGFKKTMKLYGCKQSMSRKGDCWDNAVAESFFSTLKRELVGDYCFSSLEDAVVL